MKKNLSKKRISVVSWNISNPVDSDKIIHEKSAEEILKVSADVNIIREELGTSEDFMVNLVSGNYMRYSSIKQLDSKNGFFSIMIKSSVRSKFKRASTECNVDDKQPTFLNVTLEVEKGISLHIIGVRFSEKLEKRKEEVGIFTEYLKKLKGEIILSGNFEDSEFEKIKYKRVDSSEEYVKFSNIRNINSKADFLSVKVKRNTLNQYKIIEEEYNLEKELPVFLKLTLKSEEKILHILDVSFSRIAKKRNQEIMNLINYLRRIDGEVILMDNF